MIVYTSTCVSEADLQSVEEHGMGILFAATSSRFLPTKRVVGRGIPIALDNGAFSCWAAGHGWVEAAFTNLIKHCVSIGLGKEIKWMVAPDIVMGGNASLEKSVHWARHHLDGWRCLLAVQNGMTPAKIHRHMKHFAGVFVGGNIEWKWTTAKEWTEYAHSLGKICHIGRAGETADLHRAEMLGADSADSSSFVRNKTFGKVASYNLTESHPDIFGDEP